MSAEQALATVGLTVGDVLAGTGDALADGRAYLVGSLASGLGNAGSDVDIHLLVSGLDQQVPAALHFVRDVAVDVEEYPAAWVDRILAAAAEHTAVLGQAPCEVALGRSIDRYTFRWVARWVHAAPLLDGTPPVFTDAQVAWLLPLAVREAMDQMLLAQAAAELADEVPDGQLPEGARTYLWQRALRLLLEVRCRAAGDVTTGDKWLPARAARLGFDLGGAPCRDGYRHAVRQTLGIAVPDVRLAVAVRPAADSRRAKLAGREVLVNRHDRLLGDPLACEGLLGTVLREFPAERVLEGVRRGELDLVVDADGFEGVLR
ncbi:hypothetical protein [Streptomyces sp. GbtcB6]|uniref:hypothetical protein n=1 Tax=Streptomyces sp. GbtcB6 TaxID=2824751 RepID=UPI001C2F3D40|nr:hypothetical protein [Streptomyces sp. GbtcB6]